MGDRPGEGLEEGGIEVVVPAAVDEEGEAVDGDEVGERVLVVDAAERRHLHRRPHLPPPIFCNPAGQSFLELPESVVSA